MRAKTKDVLEILMSSKSGVPDGDVGGDHVVLGGRISASGGNASMYV
jgi:hypothetical protein